DKLNNIPQKLRNMKTAKEILNEERDHMGPYMAKLDTAIAGLQEESDEVKFIYKGIQHSSISMTSIKIG
ncbi:hypothetical protein, partial [Clostridium sp.]|uniref:hypothetical protein n=1 Tax=Clostridium sp. TaxID=1506 RepID=UPI003EEB61B5